jgi:DNA modification methylase
VTGQALIVQGNGLRLPLRDGSVDLIVTSPPYAFLRSYDTGYPDLEVGNEDTPQQYLEALWAATAEMVRVLKGTGSIFVDLGDKYEGGGGPSGHVGLEGIGQGHRVGYRNSRSGAVPVKSLLLLPERYRVGCVDRLGLIARAVICWDKPNGLPESVTDRVRRSHEDWVHLTKQPRYYAATDEVRESYQAPNATRSAGQFLSNGLSPIPGGQPHLRDAVESMNPLGKLPGSVWTIPSEPLRLPDHLGVQHYAAFPSEWPRRLILGWSPPGICLDCGQGRFPVVEREYEQHRGQSVTGYKKDITEPLGRQNGTSMAGKQQLRTEARILGYACACTPHTNHPGSGEPSGPDKRYGDHLADNGYPNTGAGWGGKGGLGDRPKVGPWREYHLDRWTPPPTRPSVVLDPFGGVGTTPMVARALGRIGIGVDLSHGYCRAARWRCFESGDWQDVIARTTGRRVKPLPKQHPGQVKLL